jgi:site-specific DNA-methyltransferase (adenine-specific)
MIEPNKIINGDSSIVLKAFTDNCIDLIVTSPPYFGCRVYGNETLGREKDPIEYVNNIFEFTKEWKRVLKPQGSLYLNIGDVYFGTKGFHTIKGATSRKTHQHYEKHEIVKENGKYLQNKQLLLLPSRIAIKMQEDGWILRNQILWVKGNACPNFSEDRRLPVYEYIFHFVKSKEYYFDYELSKRLNNHRDIMECNIESFKKHPATFPEKLIYPLIRTTSNVGDIVLDPFVGAGTVAVVCKKANRKYIGIELSEENCKISEERLNELDNNLFGKDLFNI